MTTGEQLKLDGQSACLAAATVGHHDHANRIDLTIYRITATGTEWSADDVRDQVPADTREWLEHNGNVLASLIGQHAKAGRITAVGDAPTRRARRRTNRNRRWIAA